MLLCRQRWRPLTIDLAPADAASAFSIWAGPHVPHAPLQAVLAATDQQTFATLMEFVATQHQRSLDAEAGARGRRRLPTALTFAGGVNSADHAKTFPTLAQLLRDQVGRADGCLPLPASKKSLIAPPR